MGRLFGWIAGLVGIAALARVLARRKVRHRAPELEPAADPADELRRKLTESRDAASTAEVPQLPDAPPAPTETLDERRSRVHAKAQEAIDAMQDTPS